MSTPDERYADVGRGITLCFDDRGPSSSPVVVLVAGLGQQLIHWPEPLCDALVAAGHRVVRYDNRDSGRSTHATNPPPGLLPALLGRVPAANYELHDMAADLRGLLDALGVERAHVVGASMGGMIAQTAAARYPDRIASLTSIFSTTGARGIGRPHWTTWIKLGAAAPSSAQQAADAEVRMFRHIGSHGFEFRADRVGELAHRAWERDASSDGVARQMAAILKSGDRTAELAAITAPTLVVHGDRDRMVATSGGLATQRAIPGARLWVVPGMGHDYPEGLWPELVERLTAHFRDADGPSTSGAEAPSAHATGATPPAPPQPPPSTATSPARSGAAAPAATRMAPAPSVTTPLSTGAERGLIGTQEPR